MTNVIGGGTQMPTRGMNDPSPMSEPQAAAPPGEKVAEEEGEMSIRSMNAPAQAPTPIPGDSPREREKMAVYRREHPELADAQVGSMPKPGMGEP